MDDNFKASYWATIMDCLTDLHKLNQLDAEQKIIELRNKIKGHDIFYHAEPFDVACDLADQQLNMIAYMSKYKAITKRHGI